MKTRFVVYKVDTPSHYTKCCVFDDVYEATAEAEWAEENGQGRFIVKEIVEKER